MVEADTIAMSNVVPTYEKPERFEKSVLKPEIADAASDMHQKLISDKERTMLIEFVPSYCKFVLETQNEGNRNLDDSKVAIYAQEMTRKQWKRNGETIKFSKSGRLMDGQHRFSGCVRSGTPFVSFVVLGLEDSTFDTIDVGKKRTPGNMLHMAGISHGNQTAAAARAAMVIGSGNVDALGTGKATRTATEQEILTFVKNNPRISHWASAVKCNKTFKAMGNHAILSAMLFLFDRINPTACEDFYQKLTTGANMDVDHPVLQLRNRLTQIHQQNRVGRSILDVREVVSSIINAWNAFRDGRKISAIRGSTTVNNERKYPVIVNR